MEGTSTGGGGWGSWDVMGNNRRSNSGWFGKDPVSKSVNASTKEFLGDGLNADSTSGRAPAESGESQLPPIMGATLQAENRGEGKPEEEAHAWGQLAVKTEVPITPDVTTAGPTTSGDSREGGGCGEGVSGEKGSEKVTNGEWGTQMKAKKGSTSVGAPVGAGGGGDDLAVPAEKKKKKKGGISAVPVDWGSADDWAVLGGVEKKKKKKKKKEDTNVDTPVVPSAVEGSIG